MSLAVAIFAFLAAVTYLITVSWHDPSGWAVGLGILFVLITAAVLLRELNRRIK